MRLSFFEIANYAMTMQIFVPVVWLNYKKSEKLQNSWMAKMFHYLLTPSDNFLFKYVVN